MSLLLLQTTNFFLQGNTAHEQPECAQSQPAGGGSNGAVRWDGRRRAWRWRREERQYGESQPVVTQHHRDAQTAASTAAVYHQQVTRITAVQMWPLTCVVRKEGFQQHIWTVWWRRGFRNVYDYLWFEMIERKTHNGKNLYEIYAKPVCVCVSVCQGSGWTGIQASWTTRYPTTSSMAQVTEWHQNFKKSVSCYPTCCNVTSLNSFQTAVRMWRGWTCQISRH